MNTNILFTSLGKSKYKLIFWIIVAILALFTITPRGYAQSPEVTYPYKKVFVISAYYSPLENQSKYATGSYAGDIRLNGGGVHGADGTPVYPGMAAAGRMYSYGTKLKIPGFGTVAVHDRGGAIHDNRIDLWLGFGDEGLARALAWGKRSVEVTVYGVDKTLLEDVDFNSMPKANLAFLRVPSATTAVTPAVVTIQEPEIIQGTEGEHVRVIQYYLKKTGYFGGDLNGKFDEVTKNAILLFQKDRELIENESNSGAGVFGPRTQNALIETVNLAQEQQLHSLPSQTLLKGSKGNEVTALQSVLEDFGYIAEVNGIFDSATVDGLTRLQLDLDVVTSTTAYGAGVYGAKTQSAMRDLIIKSWAVPTKSQLTSARPISATVGESLSFAESSPEVYKLQEFLYKTNFLRVTPTGFYGKTTEHA
ncbi:peptidoglycan-binding protein, partial [Candidatus Gracilibacteria bacterium]|nr:peptidoglycan-binding protein [Candidatus Gracilibacteria bacterium]